MDLSKLYQQLASSLEDNPIQKAGKYWEENLNPIYDNLPWYGQALTSIFPGTNAAIAMGQMSKYAGHGDIPGMAVTGLSGIFSPLMGKPFDHIARRGMGGFSSVDNSRLGISKLGSALAVPDTMYELPEDK